MTRCDACRQAIGAADNPHTFSGGIHYHPACCPACDIWRDAGPVVETPLVERMKRGHRRGTPRAWAMRGSGG